MKICPKCRKSFERLLAVSRIDNKTVICDACGLNEALGGLPQEWKERITKKFNKVI